MARQGHRHIQKRRIGFGHRDALDAALPFQGQCWRSWFARRTSSRPQPTCGSELRFHRRPTPFQTYPAGRAPMVLDEFVFATPTDLAFSPVLVSPRGNLRFSLSAQVAKVRLPQESTRLFVSIRGRALQAGRDSAAVASPPLISPL